MPTRTGRFNSGLAKEYSDALAQAGRRRNQCLTRRRQIRTHSGTNAAKRRGVDPAGFGQRITASAPSLAPCFAWLNNCKTRGGTIPQVAIMLRIDGRGQGERRDTDAGPSRQAGLGRQHEQQQRTPTGEQAGAGAGGIRGRRRRDFKRTGAHGSAEAGGCLRIDDRSMQELGLELYALSRVAKPDWLAGWANLRVVAGRQGAAVINDGRRFSRRDGTGVRHHACP